MGSLQHLLRRFFRTPLFTAITLLTLAIGIGANTAIYSVLSGILLKPLPYPDPNRLVAVWQTAPGLGFKDVELSPASYFTYREESRTFDRLGLWRNGSAAVTGIAEPEQVQALSVSEGTLPILGIPPLSGRWFTAKDDTPGSSETVILAYGYWQRRFGGAPAIIGQRLLVDGRAREIIGIMPRGFHFMNSRPALLLPFRLNRNEARIGNFSYRGIARLKPGATLAQANADVARMIPLMAVKFQTVPGMTFKMFEEARIGPNLRPLRDDVVGDIGAVLWVLMGACGIVLAIACANVANLLLVRAEGRRQELAIRTALGAGWGRLAFELMSESLALGLAGGALGLGVAWAALKALVAMAPAGLPRLDEISIDTSVLCFTLGISLASGLLFGLFPALRCARAHYGQDLRMGSRTASDSRERHRARGVLVAVQVALAMVLLVGAGLLVRTLQALRHVQPGFSRPEEILTLRISIPRAQVKEDEQVLRMHHEILRKIAAIPSVSKVGLSSSITMDGNTDHDPVYAEDRTYYETQMPPLRRHKFISPGHFQAMGNPLVAGRDFTWTDLYEKRPVAIISENFAREYWHMPAAALGKRIRENPKSPWRQIVGVVGNERDNGVQQKAPEVVHWPMFMADFWDDKVRVERGIGYAIRSPRASSEGLLHDIRRAVWSVNPDLPLAQVRTVREIYDRSMARTSFTLVMLSAASGMALLLGLVGIYGVISYAVSQRTREIGIRIALGAQQPAIRRMFLGQALWLTAIGVVCGLAVSIPLTRLLASLLFEVSPVDPLTYAAVAAMLLLAALPASYLPARRATSIAPVEALRAG